VVHKIRSGVSATLILSDFLRFRDRWMRVPPPPPAAVDINHLSATAAMRHGVPGPRHFVVQPMNARSGLEHQFSAVTLHSVCAAASHTVMRTTPSPRFFAADANGSTCRSRREMKTKYTISGRWLANAYSTGDVRPPDYESGGRRFESVRARHKIKDFDETPC